MMNLDAQDLGPNSWAKRSAHVVQNTPSYATRASSSRGLAVVDAEMPLPNNAADDDLESDPGFVLNFGRMSAFEWEFYHPITCPRGRCLLFYRRTRYQRTR